jgi:hypothetical protein
VKRNLKIMLFSLLILLISSQWIYSYYNDEAVLNRIVNEKGFLVSLKEERVAIEFYLDPQWIPLEINEGKYLNVVIAQLNDTKVILEKIVRRETEFYISLYAKSNINRKAGEFLYLLKINEDGTFTSSTYIDEWKIYDQGGNNLLKELSFGTGKGPDTSASIFLDNEYLDMFKEGVYINYSGFHLYEYKKER